MHRTKHNTSRGEWNDTIIILNFVHFVLFVKKSGCFVNNELKITQLDFSDAYGAFLCMRGIYFAHIQVEKLREKYYFIHPWTHH